MNSTDIKDLITLLNALIIVKRIIPDVKLIVGGKGTLLEYYRKMVADAGSHRKC